MECAVLERIEESSFGKRIKDSTFAKGHYFLLSVLKSARVASVSSIAPPIAHEKTAYTHT